jgi:hypothetical protein
MKHFAEIKRFFDAENAFEKKLTSEKHIAQAEQQISLEKHADGDHTGDDDVVCMLPEGCDNEGPFECGGYCYCPAEMICQGSCPVVYAEN